MKTPEITVVVLIKPTNWKLDELTAAKPLAIGTVLKLKTASAKELIYFKKAKEYSGKIEHGKVDEEIAKEYFKVKPKNVSTQDLQSQISTLTAKVDELMKKGK